MAAGGLLAGGVAEGVKQFARQGSSESTSVFLTPGNAQKLARQLADMRGAAMKMGQLISMEGADILPREFSDALSILRGSGNTMPDSQLNRVMGREFRKGWESRFSHFDYEPVAAASIGQVHRVTTADGRDLALKIQFPGVSKSIGSDIDNLAMLLRMSGVLPSGLDLDETMLEAKRQLQREANYGLEAESLKAYRALLEDERGFVVPRVHDDFSTKRVLAMDYIEGVPVESLGESGVCQNTRDKIGRELLGLVFRELFEFQMMQSDPNFANFLYQPGKDRIVLLDFGSTIKFEPRFTEYYAGLASALIKEDPDGARDYAQKLGYLAEGGSDDYCERVLSVIRLIYEPIRTRGNYDFSKSDLFSRARDVGIEMALGDRRSYVVPPPETSYLHRKLMGSFLLCTRIQARVDVQALIQPYISQLEETPNASI